jgi:mRNA interferase RelE/StbE
MTNERFGLRIARRGDYRVLFILDVEDNVVYVHRIQRRSYF